MIHKYYKRFNEDVYIIKLKNGMQVHLLPKNDPFYTTYVELSIPYGSIHLDYTYNQKTYQTPPGTAHFMEHKIFAMPDGDAFQKFSNLGVDANAMTSYHQTSYVFSATDQVIPALTHLLDMLDTPFFTDENIEQEKLIIEEELKMYLDDPHSKMQNQLMENLYHTHTLKHDIGGTVESIKEISKDMLFDVYKHFYHPNQRLLIIAGRIDIKKMKSFFRDYDQQLQTEKKPKVIFDKEPKKLVKKYEVVYEDVQIDKMMIGIKLNPLGRFGNDLVKREMVMSMVLNMLLGSSSKMYEYLLEQQLINQSFYVNTTFEKKAENIVIYAESKYITKLKNILIKYLTKDAYLDLNEEDFNRYKKVYLGQYIFALNNLETKTYLYGKYYHYKSSLFDVIEMMQETTYDEMLDGLNRINNRSISVLIYKKAKS
jgi:predicted Zn-dependent peptidase